MLMRILTLNVYRYYNWSERFPRIVELIKRYNPDVVLLQEVQINPSFSSISQAHQLSELVGMGYVQFTPTMTKERQIDSVGGKTATAEHGLAVISKYPVTLIENYALPRHELDKEPRSVQFCEIDLPNSGMMNIGNVHLENHSVVAKFQLQALRSHIATMLPQPILGGDFNIFNFNEKFETILGEYSNSFALEHYFSYPKDDSALDYILVPKLHKLKSVICDEEFPDASDHRAVIADIML